MDSLLDQLARHGYSLLFVIVLAEAIGLPVPAALALLGAGAASAKGLLQPALCFAAAMSAMLLGDTLLYILGRKTGWWLLGMLCRISANPEACIYTTAGRFHKKGRVTLLFAKFIPGINTMAPPMSGCMRMPPLLFFRLDFTGALLYVLAYGVSGYVFSEFLSAIVKGLGVFGHAVEAAAFLGATFYLARRFWLAHKSRVPNDIPRATSDELLRRVQSTEKPLILDARSHGYYDADAQRIYGSSRLEPNTLQDAIPELPRDKEIFVYCSCVKEATSNRVAHLLRQNGLNAIVLEGGVRAWRKAGHPMEPVPADDIVLLPRFE